jgi:hypothetical protein
VVFAALLASIRTSKRPFSTNKTNALKIWKTAVTGWRGLSHLLGVLPSSKKVVFWS